jgi:hypothetical protein
MLHMHIPPPYIFAQRMNSLSLSLSQMHAMIGGFSFLFASFVETSLAALVVGSLGWATGASVECVI